MTLCSQLLGCCCLRQCFTAWPRHCSAAVSCCCCAAGTLATDGSEAYYFVVTMVSTSELPARFLMGPGACLSCTRRSSSSACLSDVVHANAEILLLIMFQEALRYCLTVQLATGAPGLLICRASVRVPGRCVPECLSPRNKYIC
jgi:hypothetical protein